MSITLQKAAEYFRPALLDDEVVAAVERMAEADYEIDDPSSRHQRRAC
ncbi:MAG: hypothetical protein WA484_10510 [Solirubrobacteraceae bacterium]